MLEQERFFQSIELCWWLLNVKEIAEPFLQIKSHVDSPPGRQKNQMLLWVGDGRKQYGRGAPASHTPSLHIRSASEAQNMSCKSLGPTDHSVKTPRPVHPMHCTNMEFRLKEGKWLS